MTIISHCRASQALSNKPVERISAKEEKELIAVYLISKDVKIRDRLIESCIPYLLRLIHTRGWALLHTYELDEILDEVLLEICNNFHSVHMVTTRIVCFYTTIALQAMGRMYHKSKEYEETNHDDYVFEVLPSPFISPLEAAIKAQELERLTETVSHWSLYYKRKVALFLDTENPRTAETIVTKYLAKPRITQKQESKRGELAPSSKLLEREVLEIRELLASGLYTQSEVGAMYKLSQSAVNKIRNRTTWSHI